MSLLQREKFLFCRFSLPVEGDAVLYTLSAQGQRNFFVDSGILKLEKESCHIAEI